MRHITNHRTSHRTTWSVAEMVAALAVAVVIALGLVGCGYGYEPLEPGAGPEGGSTAQPADPDATGAPAPGRSGEGSGDGSGNGSGDGSGNGSGDTGAGNGDRGSDGGAGEPGNPPPYIRDLYPDAYVYGDAEGIEATVQGHAFDPDGPHEQENVARVEIDWGDGNTTTAGLGGHGAFDARYDYDISYAGETMAVRVVAHGHDGQTATDSVHLALPEQ